MTIGERITLIRNTLGLTYGRMGSLCGYSGEYIKHVESGKSKPKAMFLESVSKSLHVNPEWLGGKCEVSMFLVDFEEGSSLEKNEKGLRIKSTRMEKGLSQAELAAKIRGTTKTVSDIENGKKEVTPRMALRLEKAFGVGSDWILYGDERNKECPVGDAMVEYLKNHPEDRKAIWNKMKTQEEMNER